MHVLYSTKDKDIHKNTDYGIARVLFYMIKQLAGDGSGFLVWLLLGI